MPLKRPEKSWALYKQPSSMNEKNSSRRRLPGCCFICGENRFSREKELFYLCVPQNAPGHTADPVISLRGASVALPVYTVQWQIRPGQSPVCCEKYRDDWSRVFASLIKGVMLGLPPFYRDMHYDLSTILEYYIIT